MHVLFRVMLTFNASSLLIVIYQVKTPFILDGLEGPSRWGFNLGMILIPLGLTGISILISAKLGEDSFDKDSIVSLEHANNAFLPSYLGYFFVALSIPNIETLIFVYLIIFLFTFLSQALYFNPLFLVYGFNFYTAKTRSGTSIFLISRKTYRTPMDVEISSARRVNGFTFIER